ncbi:hypothetical protein B0H14DRAFT_3130050 [Mycena olivaceomarginata]|nr:hypothetical protein B0H14DRAFT_3130050 [Mycena olivaceomarginata]
MSSMLVKIDIGVKSKSSSDLRRAVLLDEVSRAFPGLWMAPARNHPAPLPQRHRGRGYAIRMPSLWLRIGLVYFVSPSHFSSSDAMDSAWCSGDNVSPSAASRSAPGAVGPPGPRHSDSLLPNIPNAEGLSAFQDNSIPRYVSLSFDARAQATFKAMVERSHLYEGPLFSALGRFIRHDGSVLQSPAALGSSDDFGRVEGPDGRVLHLRRGNSLYERKDPDNRE